MFAPPLFGSCSHIGLAVFSRPPAGLHRPDSSDRFRAGSGPISMRVTTDLGELSEFGELAGRTRTAPKHASPSGPRRLPRAVEFREAGIHDADGP